MATHSHSHCSDNALDIEIPKQNYWPFLPIAISFILMVIGLIFEHIYESTFFNGYFALIWFLVAYILVAFEVYTEAMHDILKGEYFTELTLMIIASLGAFIIGEYPEAVAVMVFYSIGELFQESAVNRAKRNIKALVDIRPKSATVKKGDAYIIVEPEDVDIGDIIQVKAGERVPLDGNLLTDFAGFNTSAITGESTPRKIDKDGVVLSGMISVDKVVEICVTKKYADGSLAKIFEMVQDATSRKAKTELLIRRFAKVYTPIVFLMAILITFIPSLLLRDYIFNEWLYRGLVFLVISCPCALVISVPLAYFGGIGAASKAGILFKGANYLDLMAKVNTVVLDKTGTLTQGTFEVQQIVVKDGGMSQKSFLQYAASLEKLSTHPIAKAIVKYASNIELLPAENIKEIAGHGLSGEIDGKTVLAGNAKLMQQFGVEYPKSVDSVVETTVIVAIENIYVGHLIIADQVKGDAKQSISAMHKLGVKNIVMLSGDKSSIVQHVASQLGITNAFGDLLPKNKVEELERIESNKKNIVAFVGDGINDAPALALSDIGIAMGGMGSDMAIEVADVIIQTDQPHKIATSINIAHFTRRIVIQNIWMALSIKVLVFALALVGIASMWEAVFADVGVSLLAIMNAVRVLKKQF